MEQIKISVSNIISFEKKKDKIFDEREKYFKKYHKAIAKKNYSLIYSLKPYSSYLEWRKEFISPIYSLIGNELNNLRRLILESDNDYLKNEFNRLESMKDTYDEYFLKYRRLRKEENKNKFEQEVLNPHWDLIRSEEKKFRQYILSL
jgi:hypothetical protein